MSQSLSNQVVIQPCGRRSAFERYLETVASSIALIDVRSHFSELEYSQLEELFPTGRIRLWGISPGRNDANSKKWKRVQTGAFVLFTGRMGHQLGRSDIFSCGVVKFKSKNRELSLDLWGLGDTGETWDCLVFFDEVKALTYSYQQLNNILGYKANYVVRGLTVLDSAQSKEVTLAFHLGQFDFPPESTKKDLLATISEYQSDTPIQLSEYSQRLSPTVDVLSVDQLGSPAYFSSLTVENVRCFGPLQTLRFDDSKGVTVQWTIIVGDNGVGKTTLLQSLAALLPIENPALSTKSNAPRAAARYITDEGLKSDWKALRDAAQVKVFQLRCTFSVGKPLVEREAGRTTELYAIWTKKGYQYNTVNPRDLDVVCIAYGATRRLGDPSLSEKNISDPTANLFNENVELLDAEEWLLKTDYAIKSSDDPGPFREQLEKIKVVLLEILPHVEAIRIGQISELSDKPAVEFKTPFGWVLLRDLSLGYKTSVAWMVDLASRMFARYPASPTPLREPAIVLIDELDLHLHPKLQREMIGKLTRAFPNTQFIATAHSPLIVQSAVDANLVLLRREENHVVIEDDIEAVRNWRIDQVFTSVLFGIESPRPRWMDELLVERETVLSKPSTNRRRP